MPKTKYANADEKRKASNERLKERRHAKKSQPFEVIRSMSPKERKAICDHNLTKGSVYSCRVGGVEYNSCLKCPMAAVKGMPHIVQGLWYREMKRIGYF